VRYQLHREHILRALDEARNSYQLDQAAWARIWRRPHRSMVARPSRKTCQKSKRPSSSTAFDKALSEAYPAQEAELKKNNIRYEGHIYPDSVHGFFNDATPERYNKATAQQAWTRTIEWFNQYVRGSERI
jgi:chorismate mutase